MRALRLVFASVLALLAGLLAFGQILRIRDLDSFNVLAQICLLGLEVCLAASACYYFPSRAHWGSKLICPHCHTGGSLRLSTLGQPRISILAWIFTGFMGSILYSYARKLRYFCESCHEYCYLRTAGGRLASAWLFLLIYAIVATVFVSGDD